jgi:hypothetical protein
MRIEGKLTGDDLEVAIKELESRLKAHERVRVYAEIADISGMTFEAFVKDWTYGLRHLRDVEKEAVVTDRKWIEVLAEWGDALFPSLEVRHFTFDHREEALEWARS